ncbi:hypothetical protein [Streptomyces sp. NPDC049040]|uniref:hypothetical protein n=1 Tax=Streptomyces sp. NPDC049040 TaxID=3365593 RepID=UPI0037212613
MTTPDAPDNAHGMDDRQHSPEPEQTPAARPAEAAPRGESAEPGETAELAQPAEHAEPAEHGEPGAPAESAEPGPAASAEEPAERAEPAEHGEPAEAAEPGPAAVQAERPEPAAPGARAATESAGHAERAEAAAPVSPFALDGANRSTGSAFADDLAGELPEASDDEAALRDLMHRAVRDLRPHHDALDHLRRAVPARRQHRRQALAGAAAAALLVGAAVPALIHAAGAGSSTTAAPANVASTHAAQPGEDGHVNAWGSTGDSGQSGHQQDSGGSDHQSPTAGSVDGPSSQATSPGGLPPADAPECSGDQLGEGSSNADSADADGRVYGWFRVANVSTVACTVPPSSGKVSVSAQGPADLSQITVVGHTAGDPATALPASSDDEPLVLAPGEDYEVAFAWVPGDAGPGGCPPPSSPPATPTPTDTPSDTAVPDPGSGDSADSLAPKGPPPGGPSDAPQGTAISLTHVPAAGGPLVPGPTIQGACAGTIYTTAPMAPTGSGTPPS